jgi:septal ring factor EnvC (AmiA/AmiB activator)
MENDTLLLDEYRELISRQEEKLARLTLLQQRQSDLLQQEEAERKTAASTRTLQDRLLSQARSESKKLKAELADLQENAKQLGALVDKLKRSPPAAAPAAQPGAAVDFSRQRGSLAWPLEGAVLISFGTQRDSKLGTFFESNGIEIAARPGSEVRSVANGQVVYADYFRGYGNLLIISHEGAYHTLYAQLDRIDKKTGDRVAAGAPIGRSGLAGRESIYFEIRHNGAPVNPLTWLKR